MFSVTPHKARSSLGADTFRVTRIGVENARNARVKRLRDYDCADLTILQRSGNRRLEILVIPRTEIHEVSAASVG